MNKLKLFIDFDSTIVNSIEAYVKTYNEHYEDYEGFIPATTNIKQYDFKDQCPLVSNPLLLFKSLEFFNYLNFINDNTKIILELLQEKFNIAIVTIGTPKNIQLKTEWISKNLPFIEKCYLIYDNPKDKKCIMDKSSINMTGGIIIDDMIDNLNSSNATQKYIFGKEYNWNITEKYERLLNWTKVYEKLVNL